MVELGAQDKELVLKVAGQGPEETSRMFPKSSILNSESPLWGKFLATSLYTQSPNELAHLLSVITREIEKMISTTRRTTIYHDFP
jgi:hypothetical protein